MVNPFTLPLPGLLMRLAVALSFIYPAVSAWFDPYAWIGYFPGFLLDLAGTTPELLLHAWGAFEILLALWIVFGKRVYVPSAIATAALIAVVAANPGQLPILFRDVSIALAATSLALINWQKYGRNKNA